MRLHRFLWLAIAGVMLAVGGLLFWLLRNADSGAVSSGDAAVDAAARSALIACNGDPACQTEKLNGLVKTNDPDFALRTLDAMAGRNVQVSNDIHVYAHEIGYATYAKYPTLPERLSHCRDTAASGCFHGVMMKQIGDHGLPKPAEVRAVCDEVQASRPLYFQCLHGLGHGVVMGQIMSVRGEPGLQVIRGALTDCDYGHGWYEQQSCYGGAFMEYLIASGPQIFHYPTKTKYKPDDINWPCSVLAEKYIPACYQIQGRVILDAKKWNFAETFKACDQAPESGRAPCAEHVGSDAMLNADERRFPYVIESCNQTVSATQRGACLVGAARNVINFNNAAVPLAFKLCAQARGEGPAAGGVQPCVDAVRSDARFYGWTDDKIEAEMKRQGLSQL